ncbi:pyridoxamine 5'-phosphate oxidase family protein [Cellvibrio sp. OA-2007]|uniref:pyridoxamine 5'-phosphate oxidase family protein n=1 Tax=Cellvibrio sp. OA-2007 TaxID=529823 RepID=UPI0007864AAB|nr:pyridoxamine 5'-phosphate oxidase family protein [Cellvibrio sp. OA-2007]
MNNSHTTAPSPRTRIRRIPELASYDRSALYQIIDESYVCHIAFHDGENSHCIPTACWRDEDFLYIHGSNGGRLTKMLLGRRQVSIAITHVDGLVLAKSAFSHTMNYRSAVIYGAFELIEGREQKLAAMDVFMDKIAAGRKQEARPGNDKELAATSVLRISLVEAASKISNTLPVDKEEDLDLPVWAGVLPLRVVHGEPIHANSEGLTTPDYVKNWAQ